MPNLQNVPHHTPAGNEIRAAFQQDLSGADYKEVEMKIMDIQESTMIQETTFDNVRDMAAQGTEGLVLLGCGGDPMEWVDGVAKLLRQEGIVASNFNIDRALKLTTTGGRTDLLLLFSWDKVDPGRLAIWRIGFGDCSWLSDYVVNYADHHGYSVASDEYDD